MKKNEDDTLKIADKLLFIPDIFNYLLTGVMKNEYTIASTSQLLNPHTKKWDDELLEKLGIDRGLFCDIIMPGETVGYLTDEICEELGCKKVPVIAVASHDTASAVAACPIDDSSVYISSGTWSLMGTENREAKLGEISRNANFTNEGGVEYRFRFLKNIMGMWLFQNVRRNLDKKYSYDEMMKMAMASNFTKIIDVNDESLVCPESMIDAVNKLAGNKNLPLGDTLSCIYHSLASMYAKTVREIEDITGKSIDSIFIVGGGSKDTYLNSLTAQYTGKKVVIGLGEATATGNLIAQIMRDKQIDLDEARKIVIKSFNIREAE
jgi:rhamnulokinase